MGGSKSQKGDPETHVINKNSPIVLNAKAQSNVWNISKV